MRRTLLSLMAASSLAIAVPAIANAQGWESMSQRQYSFSQRIEQGVRTGAITPTEASRLRADFDVLVRLETDYRRSAPGLTQTELQDLDRRFDLLSDRLNLARNDRYDRDGDRYGENDRYGNNGRGDGRYVNIAQRRDNLARRIDQGVRSGQLTRAEAADLRREYDQLVRLEGQYRTSGGVLTRSEIAELDRRYDELTDDVRMARSDRDRERGGDRDREWADSREMNADLDRRIAAAEARGRINRTEARRLHDDADALVQLEAQYRASSPGLTPSELAELDRRVDLIERRIGDNVDYGFGYGYGGSNYRR
jgi:hypothetical protein